MAESVPNEVASFLFDRLLPEIQLLVLEAALPPQRIFHVSDATQSSLTFYIQTRHPPCCPCAMAHAQPSCVTAYFSTVPMAPSSCPPSTCFISTAATAVTSTDCISYHARTITGPPSSTLGSSGAPCLRARQGSVQGRALGFGGVRRAALAPLRVRMPALQSVTYVLLMVRHPGGLTWGTEPYGAQLFAPGLVTLPEETRVPWGDSLVMNEVPEASSGGQTRNLERVVISELLLDGRKSYLVPWGEMKGVIEEALKKEEEDCRQESDWQTYAPGQEVAGWQSIEAVAEKKDWLKLVLKGCWLLRKDAAYDEDVTSFPS